MGRFDWGRLDRLLLAPQQPLSQSIVLYSGILSFGTCTEKDFGRYFESYPICLCIYSDNPENMDSAQSVSQAIGLRK